MKRVLIVSDLHSGHLVGLTDPEDQLKPIKNCSPEYEKLRAMQQQCYSWWKDNIHKYGPFDVILPNGDLIDGRGERSGGSELITTNRERQCEMSVKTLRVKGIMKRDTRVYMTRGTSYHTGESEDWENKIAGDLEADIKDEQFLNIEGVKFNLKHHVGSSSNPSTRYGAVAREQVWNVLKVHEGYLSDPPDIVIRSHVHYHVAVSDPMFLGMTTPALQGPATKYGGRRCSGIVHFGFVIFECNNGSYTWKLIIAKIPALRTQYTKVP